MVYKVKTTAFANNAAEKLNSETKKGPKQP